MKRTLSEFSEDNLSDWAAALTYYGLLALFPALIALVSIVGLVGDPAATTKTLTQIVAKVGPASAAQTLAGPIRSVTARTRAESATGRGSAPPGAERSCPVDDRRTAPSQDAAKRRRGRIMLREARHILLRVTAVEGPWGSSACAKLRCLS